MQPLTQEFLDRCPEEGGFRLRGMEMTRIEVLVDAGFAFCITMLMISFDAIPRSFEEMVLAIKVIPAFIVAVAQIVWIWYAHNVWSRRYGLQDATTVLLSACLLIVVLIYIYPLRIMAQGMFSWFTSEYLPAGFALRSLADLRFMFVFMGVGFAALCGIFSLLYAFALRRSDFLRLSGSERYQTQTLQILWFGTALIGLVAIVLAVTVPDSMVPFTGFAYSLMAFWFPLYGRRRRRYQHEHFPVHFKAAGD